MGIQDYDGISTWFTAVQIMATTFTELLKQAQSNILNPVLASGIISEAISGFAKGVGAPSFQTQAKSMSWLLEQAKKVRAETLNVATTSGIKSVEPREVLAQAVGRDEAGKYVKGNQAAIAKPTTMMKAGDM